MEKTQRSGFGFNAAFQRQAWRPPALRSWGFLSAGLLRRNAIFGRAGAGLLAWHSRFALRGHTLAWWPYLEIRHTRTLSEPSGFASVTDAALKDSWPGKHTPARADTPPFDVFSPSRSAASDLTTAANPSTQMARGRTSPAYSQATQTLAKENPAAEFDRAQAIDSGHQPPEPTFGAPNTKLVSPGSIAGAGRTARQLESGSTSMARRASPDEQPSDPSVVRPMVKMGPRQPVSGTARRIVSRFEVPRVPEAAVQRQHSAGFPTVVPLEMRQVLVPAVRASPRQEVPAGFSTEAAIARSGSETGMNGPATAARETAMSPMTVSLPGRSAARVEEKQVAFRSPGSDNAEASGPVSLTREVIPHSGFRSIEAGFALGKGARGGERETSSSEGAPAQTPSPVAPLSMAPPALDINAVADKVYQALVRRHRFEQERRGLY